MHLQRRLSRQSPRAPTAASAYAIARNAQRLPAQELHVSGMVVVATKAALSIASVRPTPLLPEINPQPLRTRTKTLILAYALYYPAVGFLLGHRHRLHVLSYMEASTFSAPSLFNRSRSEFNRHKADLIPMWVAASCHAGRCHRLHAIRHALLPAHPWISAKNTISSKARWPLEEPNLQAAGHPADIAPPAIMVQPQGPGRIEFDHVYRLPEKRKP